MTEKYIFQDLLGCEDSLYTAWGFNSYENFKEKIAKPIQSGLNSSQNDTNSGFHFTFLIISFLVLLISSSIVLMVWYLRPHWMTKIIQIVKSPFN